MKGVAPGPNPGVKGLQWNTSAPFPRKEPVKAGGPGPSFWAGSALAGPAEKASTSPMGSGPRVEPFLERRAGEDRVGAGQQPARCVESLFGVVRIVHGLDPD